MYGLSGFGSIKGDLIFIAVLSVILSVLLLYEHRQKKLMEKEKEIYAKARNDCNK